MTYREHAPSPSLQRRVACIWTSRAHGSPSPLRVLPDGCIDLVFRFDRDVSASVAGIMTTAQLVPPSDATYVGVRFRPGEAFSFLDVPARATRDLSPDLSCFWPDARELSSRLAEAAPRARVALLDAALVLRLARVRPAEPRVRAVVGAIEASAGALSVAHLARRVGLGERQLVRLFDERVGLGPKALARIARLAALVRAIRSPAAGPVSWVALAAELGYADQAHLARDVRELAGVTPSALAGERRLLAVTDSSKTEGGEATMQAG